MSNFSKCRGCLASVHVSEKEIDEAIFILSKNKNTKFVDDETYEFRLSQCKTCNFLEYETTCLKCGCIVQIRAKLADSSCPNTKESRW